MVANPEIDTAFMKEAAKTIRAYDRIYLSGIVYTARDAAHQRICAMLRDGIKLPFSLDGASIYYTGPTNAPMGLAIGSCGPTTSSRMDMFSPALLERGLSCMIGKGERSEAVIESIVKNKAVYLCAIGGAGALACKCVKKAEVIGFPELGCESVKRLTIERFPLIAAIDCIGGNIFRK